MIIHVNNANYDDNSTEKNESSCERTVEDKKVIISRSEEEEKRSYNSSVVTEMTQRFGVHANACEMRGVSYQEAHPTRTW